jgi:hypothetical protein
MFVMAIGLLGILALFPLGVLQMASSVKDERSLQTAQIVDGNARILWRLATQNATTEDQMFQFEPGLQAFENPDPAYQTYNAAMPKLIDPTSTEPSLPIYFDPIGYSVQPGNQSVWVAGLSAAAGSQDILPRRNIAPLWLVPPYPALTPQQLIATRNRLFCLNDDLTFSPQGTANPVIRDGKYSAAFLVQRPNNLNYNQANVTVVVYRNRPFADTFSAETVVGYNAALTPGSTSVSFPKAGIPALRKGTWILLAGRIDTPANTLHQAYAYANFYRIVSVQDDGVQYMLEVSPPLRQCGPPGTTSYPAYIIAMDNVAEIFEKPMMMPN